MNTKLEPKARGAKAVETTSLLVASSVLRTISESTGSRRLETQQLLLLMELMLRSEIPQADLPGLSGVGENAVSRNITLLGQGTPKEPGHGLVESFEDPDWRRRKLVRLTPKGRTLAADIGKACAKFFTQPGETT